MYAQLKSLFQRRAPLGLGPPSFPVSNEIRPKQNYFIFPVVKEARLKEIKAEILNSEKLKVSKGFGRETPKLEPTF